MRNLSRRDCLRYGVAVASVVAAVVLRLVLGQVIDFRAAPLLLTACAVVVSAWHGGFGPGVLAAVLGGLLAQVLFISAHYSVISSPVDNLRLTMFFLFSLLISFLFGRLRHSESRYRAILQFTGDAVIVTDHDDRIVEFNESAEKMFGYHACEAIGKELQQLIVLPPDRPVVGGSLARRSSANGVKPLGQRVELVAIKADGAELPVEVSTTRVGTDGAPVFANCIRDLTYRQDAERQLARQTQTAMLLQQAAMLSAAASSFDMALQSCVEIVCKIIGSPAGCAFLPDPVNMCLKSSRIWYLDSPERFAPLRLAIESLTPSSGEGLAGKIWKTGEPVWVEDVQRDETFSGVKLPPELGIKGAFGFAVKIGAEVVAVLKFFSTGETKRDPELLHLAGVVGEQLGRVIERRRNEEEIRRGKDAAESANRSRSAFLANVSHELRTPMNAVIGMIDLSLGEDLSTVTRDYLSTARDSAGALLFLLNDILDLSRMEAGRFELESAPFSLRETLDETMKTLSVRAHEKGLELACHVHRDVPDELVGDSRRLRQVMMNLAGNATKFTERGEIVVDVSVEHWTSRPSLWHDPSGSAVLFTSHERRTPPTEFSTFESSLDDAADVLAPADAIPRGRAAEVFDEVALHFTVTDTGIGIAPEDQARIFDAFIQIDASTTRSQSGTGLGLAICRELVARMGGRSWVESQLGRGSRFHFTARFQLAPAQPVVEPPQNSAFLDLRGLPVLVVDDNRTNRRILEDLLTGWDMRPTSAADARMALLLLQDAARQGRPYSLALIDALMPVMDGYALVEQIRQTVDPVPAVILMLSSTDRQQFHERGKGLGIAGYLRKPVSQSDLLDSMTTVLIGPQQEITGLERMQTALRPLRVLLAEDTPANQKVVTAILTKRGHLVELAKNGREAIETVQRGGYDMVLMDIQMPVMDGVQATKAIRRLEDPDFSRIPIVAMTAHTMRGDRERCVAAGMDAFLSKPVHAERLIRVVERLAAYLSLTVDDDTDRDAARHALLGDSGSLDRAVIPRAASVDASASTATGAGAASKESEPVVINKDAIIKRLGDEELFFSLIRFFDEDAPGLLESIRTGSQQGDAELVVRSAHSLKGLVANFDAVGAMTAAMRVQQVGESGRLHETGPLLAALENEITRLTVALAPFRS